MRDPAVIYTKRGTPLITIVSRIGFAVYFLVALYMVYWPPLPQSRWSLAWLVYLFGIYVAAEWSYKTFRERQIDMTFAWPLLLAIYLLNFGLLLFGGQEALPLMNRLEHFASFILLAYVISVFFSKYLPQRVWRSHPYYTALLVLSVTSLCGVANELIELLFDGLFDTTLVGTELDTSLDLLMNTLGAGLLLSVQLIVPKGLFTSSKTPARLE